MLKLIRDNAKGVVAWIIVIIIIIPFALWGVNEYFEGGGEVVVAKIGDRDVSLGEYQNLYQRELAARRQAMGSAFNASDPSIRRDVIERLVNIEVMTQAARDSGFRIADARLGQRIVAMREFQDGGRFDPALYDRLLRASGLSKAQFEEDLRNDLLLEQFIGGVSETAFLTARDLDALLRMIEQRRRFAHLVLPVADYATRVEVDEERIARYYEENRSEFAVPERVTAQYLELSMSSIVAGIEVDDETIRRLYEERAPGFTVGEERRARHILIEVDQAADAGAIEAARTRAEELLAAIEGGESFEEVARNHSDDSGSARSGGDLGFFTRGAMVPSFEEAVFSMSPGELRGPVQSPFGFHLIRLEEIRPGSVRPFEEMAPILKEEYRQARAEERFFDLTERLADLTFEHSDTLAVAAEELGLPLRETEPFSVDAGQGIAMEGVFRDAAFSPDVLESGHNSPLVELGQSRVVVLRIADRYPASHLPLAEVRDRIERELHRHAAAEMARKDGERIVARLAEGASMEELAREHRAEWHPSTTVRRDDAELDPAVLGAAFSMPRPAENGEPVIEGVELLSGDYAVLALYEVMDGNPGDVAALDRRMQGEAVAQFLGQRAVQDLIASLRERKKVRVFEDRL